jgi:rod shape determining protein RodA
MLYRRANIKQSIDWFTVVLYLIMVVAGWFTIYAATYDYDQTSIFDLSGRAGMQMIWIFTSILIACAILLIDSNWYESFAVWIYAAVILLLVVTLIIAPDIKGSRSWLVLGPIRLQPAEFAKFATALVVAKMMGQYRFEIMKPRNLFPLLGFIFLPMALIVLQQETGSALVFLAFLLVMYREGLPGAVLFSGFAAGLIFITAVRFAEVNWGITPAGEVLVLLFIFVFAIGLFMGNPKGQKSLKGLLYVIAVACALSLAASFLMPFNWCWTAGALIVYLVIFLLVMFLKYRVTNYLWIVVFVMCSVAFLYSVDHVFSNVLGQHQKIRIEVALGMIDDPSGAGYNVNQSKIAIGSGGLLGKGYLNGTQTKLKYVPEQDTDFIFCTVGEEEGFVGSTVVLLLFLAMILRLVYLAERQKSAFNRVYGYSVASILLFHLAVNIGMVTGITPVIGIPLPFFSYGGSSLWSFTILLFIFLRLDAQKFHI